VGEEDPATEVEGGIWGGGKVIIIVLVYSISLHALTSHLIPNSCIV
jgi:hypothetical protein